jgi:hypothetical protein
MTYQKHLYADTVRVLDPDRVAALGPSASPHECIIRFTGILDYICHDYAGESNQTQTHHLSNISVIFDELLSTCSARYPEMLQDSLVDFLLAESRSKPYSAPSWNNVQAASAVRSVYPALKQFLDGLGVSLMDALCDSQHRYRYAVKVVMDKPTLTLVNLMPVPCGQQTVIRLCTQGLLAEHLSDHLHPQDFTEDQLQKLYRAFNDRQFLLRISDDHLLEDSLSQDLGL